MNEFLHECIFLLRTRRAVSKIDRVVNNSDYYVISMYDINEHGEPVDIRTFLSSGAKAREYVQDLLGDGTADGIFDE